MHTVLVDFYIYKALLNSCIVECFLPTEYVIYDDACHLKKFAMNKTRSTQTDTSRRIASMNLVVDRFHFPGHVDPWCKKNCNPDDFSELEEVRVLFTSAMGLLNNSWRNSVGYYGYIELKFTLSDTSMYMYIYNVKASLANTYRYSNGTTYKRSRHAP